MRISGCNGLAAALLSVAVLLLAAAAASAEDNVPLTSADMKPKPVTYDGRSLIINGKRELLFSGSIHYPRSLPEMWPDLIKKSKAGGLNVIQTYVFWNGHEPVKGQYNFEGRYDLVRFVKEIQKQGLFCTLRIGPFIQGEWHHGGFPFWLREEPGMIFRTDNNPFKYYMRRFVKLIIDMMQKEKLFAPQGGPIILAQLENEYDMVKGAYREAGEKYVKWVGDLGVNSKSGVPWMMCKAQNAPGAVINACNGRNCGDVFKGPNSPTKPVIWAEDWTQQFRKFGDPPSQRSAEDLAYSGARFFSKNGTLMNYYMYHGGTNFGNTGASFVTPRYYDEAPLDEYGLLKEPKWGHLRDLHHALRLSQEALLEGTYSVETLGKGLEARLYQIAEKNLCVAFLNNDHKKLDSTVTFRGKQYFLPRRSISILPDCKTVFFNTEKVNSQHNFRTYIEFEQFRKSNGWEMFRESIPRLSDSQRSDKKPIDLFNMTRDDTDYLWYMTDFVLDDNDLPRRKDVRPVLQVQNLGHAMLGFANGEYLGHAHGLERGESFVFAKPMNLREGRNQLRLLATTVGHPDAGAYLEHAVAGVHEVDVQGLNAGTVSLTLNKWGHLAGMAGEQLKIYHESGLSKVQWRPAKKNLVITWYKRRFDAPSGTEPVAIDMSSMSKGIVWVNGESIGRYWVSFKNPLGKPTQHMYHVPRQWLKPKDNLMVVLEELGGDPAGITMATVKRDNICISITARHLGDVEQFKVEDGLEQKFFDLKPQTVLRCEGKKVINSISFADFGNPSGSCGEFFPGNCSNPLTKQVVEKKCLGKSSCKLDAMKPEIYGADMNCQGTMSTLTVQAKCSRSKKGNADNKPKPPSSDDL